MNCSEKSTEIFPAHTGVVPVHEIQIEDLSFQNVTTNNIKDFIEVKIKAFKNGEDPISPEEFKAELIQRKAELKGNGCGTIAYTGTEPVGIIWWYEEYNIPFIQFLAVRIQFRKNKIGTALVVKLLKSSYAKSLWTVVLDVIIVNIDAIRLYNRLGFTDRVYWRKRYLLNPTGVKGYRMKIEKYYG